MPICSQCGKENPEGAKFCNECATPLAETTPSREQRKTVTVLFCDVTGSTELGEKLDPEPLRALLARYFECMKEIVERHGGSVEKFIGDAVMAVFGVPVVHEDDALRAARAAIEMREAFPELAVQGRIGITTGEVVTGTEERLATGDAVNVAARLEQAAQPGEILIGEQTLRLVRNAVQVEQLEPLALKGKAKSVAAYRMLSVRPGAPAIERHLEAPMVGRTRELRRVQDAFAQAVQDRSCLLFTILGLAGVGKSRLATDFLAGVGETTVVGGRCLPYGEGITYWPVVEILRQLDVVPTEESAAAAIRSLLGETEAATSAEEIAWAFRKTLEQAAAERPLVVVFDDIQWGEETFLDLIEHVALLSSGVPILLLCLARPELADRRPAWSVALRLEPLSDDEVALLLPARIGGKLREKITRAAGGNPLFVGEMVAMAGEAQGDVAVPPTLQALLAARLDQLETAERRVLERGAIEGEIFHRGAVQALAPEETQVTPRLAALVRRELIRPDRAQIPGDDGFRFLHLLIRDAAYDALPKAVRAELHKRFADWLEEYGRGIVELDEILGYHLEQAYRYREELGLAEDEQLTARARHRLSDAGRRALLRLDSGAAVNLLERAAALVPGEEIDVALEVDLADAHFAAGRVEHAYRCAGAAAERAAAAGERVAELCCRIEQGIMRINVEPEGATERLAALAEEALAEFETPEDDFGLCLAYRALAVVAHMRARMDEAGEALQQALVYARRLGLPHYEASMLFPLASARSNGTTPIPELLAWLDEQEARGVRDTSLRRFRSEGLAMLGRFEEARTILSALRSELADRGATLSFALATARTGVEVEVLAGDPAAAVGFGEEGCRLLEEAGERSWLSTTAGYLGQALYSLDRLEEAETWADRAAELGASDDAITQMLWRQVSAKLLVHRGDTAEAEKLAREAVALGDETEMLNAQGDAYSDLGEVLALAGKPDETVDALERALALYERKGNLVKAERARRRLEKLTAATTGRQAGTS